MLVTIMVSALTSIVCATAVIFFYTNRPMHATTAKRVADVHYAAYGKIINTFLTSVRQGNIQAAYAGTSPVFQKLTTQNDFQKLVSGYQLAGSIPAGPCTVTAYSDPFSSSISGVTGAFSIVQTKCEATESGITKGFDMEFISDNGTPKISYINAYSSPVMHTKNPQVN